MESCRICGTTENISWDHDHASGAFRGWLCRGCNNGLGSFRDDPRLLRRAADYLSEDPGPDSRTDAIVEFLRVRPASSVREIAERVGLAKSVVHSSLRWMQERGLVNRIPCPDCGQSMLRVVSSP